METLPVIEDNMAQDSKKKKTKEVPKDFDEKIRRSLRYNPNDPQKKTKVKPKKK